MKFITGLLFTFICLLPAGSMAQNKVTLSGKVTDQHGAPVAQATIAVETPPPVPIRMTVGNIHCKSLQANIPSSSPSWATKP